MLTDSVNMEQMKNANIFIAKCEIKETIICSANLKIHLAIRASSTETAAPALP